MRQLLQPLRLVLPALLLGGFASQAQNLNYTPATATNVAGTYTDLGTTGTVIATANNDAANSTAQPIGFTFSFNGATFTDFVLNTNGFIKLGTTAPSSASLHYQAETTFGGDALGSANPADVNIIAPFNVDLENGTAAGGAEYRVATTGTAPNRVCVIQWKNVRDKMLTNAPAYDSFNFQARLTEGSNVIEFVYGAAVPGATGADAFRLGAAGIKGSGAATGQTVLVNKTTSGGQWSTAVFIAGPYTGSALNYRRSVAPDLGRTFRFTPAVLAANDIAVNVIYTLGKVSSAFGSPVTVQAVITNNSATTKTAVPVTLTVSGATTFTNTQTVASVASNATAIVTFAAYPVTGTSGANTLTVTVPMDDVTTNNSQTFAQTISANDLSYLSGAVTGGVGVPSAGNVVVVKHQATVPTTLTTVTPVFNGLATVGSTYQVLVFDVAANGQPGTVLYTSPVRPRPSAATTTTTIADPVTVPAIPVTGAFFVGVKTIGAENIALAYQTETPTRTGTFFFTTTTAAPFTWVDLATQTIQPRIIIDATLGSAAPVTCDPVTALTAGSITGTGASISFTAPAGATAYTVTYTAAGGMPVTVTPAVTASPFTLTGLTAGTAYTVSVINNCGGTNGSSVATTTTFTTTGGGTGNNDDCAGAVVLTPGFACTPTAGTVAGATQSIAPILCNGFTAATARDVWYSFTATSTTHTVAVTGTFDGILEVLTGTCAAPANFACADDLGNDETLTMTNLTVGVTYLVRYYAFVTAPASSTFSICVTTPSPNDAAVSAVYTLGAISSTYGSPHVVQAVVDNVGSAAKTNLVVTLTVTGANPFTATQTIPSLASGASTTVTFPGYTVVNGGTNTVTVSVPADAVTTNDSRTETQVVTAGDMSYVAPTVTTFDGGLGSNTAANALLFAKYTTTAAASVTAITAAFEGTAAATDTYQFLVYDASGAGGTPGAVLYTSPTRVRPATSTRATLSGISVPVSGSFFVAVKQLTTTNIGLAYMDEEPLRPGTFYFSATGATFIDLSSPNGLPARFALGVTLDRAATPVTGLLVGNVTSTSASVVFTAPTPAPTGYTVTLTPTMPGGLPIVITGTSSPITIPNLAPGTTYTVTVVANYPGGVTSSPVNATFTTLLGARASIGGGMLSLFPNPAQQRFTLSVPAIAGARSAQLTLVNALGQNVLTRTVALQADGTKVAVDVDGLATGMYTLRVQAGSESAAIKVAIGR